MSTNAKYPRGVELVGSAIIENNDGKILLTQSPKWSNKWTLPGGHVEPGETILDALTREAIEETGLQLQPIAIISWGELIGSADFHRPAHFVYFDAYCKQLSGSELKLDGQELTTFTWVTPEEALNMDLAESYPETIKKFIEYKKHVL